MDKQQIIETTKKVFKELSCDGHTIMDPQFFKELGYPDEFVDKITHVHVSGEQKYAIYDNDGEPVKQLGGVHYLDFWENLSGVCDPSFSSYKNGRGFRAREYYNRVEHAIGEA